MRRIKKRKEYKKIEEGLAWDNKERRVEMQRKIKIKAERNEKNN